MNSERAHTGDRVQALLQAAGIQSQHAFVCILLGADTAHWSVDYFAMLADWLFERDYPVIFVGEASERDKIRAICKTARWFCHDFSQRLSPAEVQTLIGFSALTIGVNHTRSPLQRKPITLGNHREVVGHRRFRAPAEIFG